MHKKSSTGVERLQRQQRFSHLETRDADQIPSFQQLSHLRQEKLSTSLVGYSRPVYHLYMSSAAKKQRQHPGDRPSVYAFHDYREFLSAHLSFLKGAFGLSARMISQQAGLSHGYLSLVLNKERNLTEASLGQLLSFLDLDLQEIDYLRQLIILGDSPSAEERNAALESLQNRLGYKDRHPKEFETYRYLDKWYHVAIRELAQLKDFRADPEWIQTRLAFPVRRSEIQEALDFLVQGGFLVEVNGELKPSQRDLKCIGGVYQMSLAAFHKSMLAMAQESLDRFERHERQQIGYSFAVDQKDFAKVEEILREAKEKIQKLESDSKDKNSVYHISFSAFPLALKKQGGSKNE